MVLCYIATFPMSQNESEVDTPSPKKNYVFLHLVKIIYFFFVLYFPIYEWDLIKYLTTKVPKALSVNIVKSESTH